MNEQEKQKAAREILAKIEADQAEELRYIEQTAHHFFQTEAGARSITLFGKESEKECVYICGIRAAYADGEIVEINDLLQTLPRTERERQLASLSALVNHDRQPFAWPLDEEITLFRAA